MSIDLSLYSGLGELHDSQPNQISAPATSRLPKKQEMMFPSSRTSRRITSEIDLHMPNATSTMLNTTKTAVFTQQTDEIAAKQLYEQIKQFPIFEALSTGRLGVQFDEFGLKQFCGKLKMEEYSKNKMLFQEDKKSNGNMYIIYSGEVNLHKENISYPVNPMQFSDYLHRGETAPELRSDMKIDSSPQSFRSQTRKLDRSELEAERDILIYGNVYQTLGPGDHFGEQEIQGGKARSFTAITSSACKLLVLKKMDFYFLRENFDQKRKKLRGILEELTPKSFKGDIYNLVSEIVNHFEEKTFERGTTFLTEGEINDTVYIVADGTCELIKNMRIDESANLNDDLIPIKQLLRVAPTYNEALTICSTHKGFLGEEILFVTSSKNSFTVKVASGSATVFALNKNELIHKFPPSIRKEIEKTFQAKQKHYAQIISTIVEKIYPNMRIVVKDKDKSEVEMLNNQIMLLPIRQGKVNLKIKRMFRADTMNTDRTLTPDRSKDAMRVGFEAIDDDMPLQKMYLNTETHERETPLIRPKSAAKGARIKSRGKIRTRGLDAELENMNMTDNLKLKFGRTHITGDLPKNQSYISTSPVPRIINLNEKSMSLINKNSFLNTEGYEEESPLLKGQKDRKGDLKILGFGMSNNDLQHLDYGKFVSPSGNVIIKMNTAVNIDRAKTKSAELSNKGVQEQKTLSDINDDIKDSMQEIRQMLLGKELNSKDYRMAKKRLQLKLAPHRPVTDDSPKDVSFGKRVNALIKPVKDRKAKREMENQFYNSPIHSARAKNTMKLDFSPLRTLERMPTEFVTSFKDVINCQFELENKSLMNPYRTEAYHTERTNESIEPQKERKLGMVEFKPLEPMSASSSRIKLGKKHRKTSSMKINLVKVNNKKIGIERELSIENKIEREKISPAFCIRAHSLMRGIDVWDLSIVNDERNKARTHRDL